MKILIIAAAAHGSGISGSDRIFIEFAKRWLKKAEVAVLVGEEGYEMCQRNGLSKKEVSFIVLDTKLASRLGFFVDYFARIFRSILFAINYKVSRSDGLLVYSASEFWMDSLPAFVLKTRLKKVRWSAAWYQTAPSPIQGFSSGRYRFKAFLYWFVQLPVKPLIENFSDFVLVNNREEKKQFPKHTKNGKSVVVQGAVDLKKIDYWKKKFAKEEKIYDAVFQGRFHPQKGVEELVDIWQDVVKKKPDAYLAMIGDGPLRKNVELRIKDCRLEKNIKLFGYLFDGPEKYRIFSQSEVVLHPAFFDSGGMASGEAMAFGIPCVGFDLPSYKHYYPKGMVKVKKGDLKSFSGAILRLLNSSKLRKRIGREALKNIQENWSWDERANEVLKQIL